MGAILSKVYGSQSVNSRVEDSAPPKGFPQWMAHIKSDESKSLEPKDKIITEEDLSIHCNEYDMWVALKFKDKMTVFDVTKFAEYHPGGFNILLKVSGSDATEAFKKVHPYVNLNAMSKYQVGYLQTSVSEFNSTDKSKKEDTADGQSVRSWFVEDCDKHVTLTIKLNYPLMQGLDQVSIILKEENHFHLRIFQDINYYILDIDLLNELSVNLDSLNISQDKLSISLKLTKSSDIAIQENIGVINKEQWVPNENVYDDLPFIKCKVISNERVTHDTFHLELLVPDNCRLSYPLGHHLLAATEIQGDTVSRPYSPIAPSLLNPEKELATNKIHLLFKLYPDGQMTNHLAKLQSQDQLTISPTVGNMTWSLLTDRRSALFLVAGTGLTAVQKIVHEILYYRPEIKRIHFLYFNKTEVDIIIRDDLTKLATRFDGRFLVTYVLSAADSSWTGHRGRVSAALVQEVVPELELTERRADRICFVCGPLPFHKTATAVLMNYGVPEKLIFEFKG